MNKKTILTFLIFILLCKSEAFTQTNLNKQDTTFGYLLNKCFELFEPHSELTYSFGTDELKNESPDLSNKIPVLKDTTKFFDELKGNYKDWLIFYKIGNLYHQFNKEQNAMTYYNQAYNLIYNEIKKDTLKASPFSDMGSLYLNLNNNDNAFYFFQKAYALNEKDSAASMFLPMFYIFNGDPKKSEELIRKRLSYDPQNTDMYIWLLTSKIYQKISAINKDDPKIPNQPIDELFDLKDLADAAKKYKNDIRFTLLEQLGRQLALFAKYSAIASSFKDAKLAPVDIKELKNIQNNLQKIIDKKQFKNNYIIYKSLGFSYLLDKDAGKATEYFRKALSLWPKNKNSRDYYILFTTQYFIKNDTLEALKVIDEKIKNDAEISSSNAGDYVLKGNVLLQKHDFDGAEKAFNEALQLAQLPEAYLGLSLKPIKNGDLAGANVYINKAYDLNKDNYLTYALFGIITLMNDQKDKSKPALEKSLELKPDDKVIKEIYEAFFPK